MFQQTENAAINPSTDHHDVMHQAVHTENRPGETGADHPSISGAGQEAGQENTQITLDQVIRAYGAFAKQIDDLIGKIPDGIPVLGALKKMAEGKAELLKSSLALSLGFDVDRQQFVDNWQERLQLVGSHLTSSLLSDAQALFEILTLSTGAGSAVAGEAAMGQVGAQSTLQFVEFLGKLKDPGAAKAVVSLLPDALKNLIPRIQDEGLKGTLAQLTHAVEIMLSNEKIQTAATDALQSQSWWQKLQEKLQAGQMNVDEFQKAVAEVDEEMKTATAEQTSTVAATSTV